MDRWTDRHSALWSRFARDQKLAIKIVFWGATDFFSLNNPGFGGNREVNLIYKLNNKGVLAHYV